MSTLKHKCDEDNPFELNVTSIKSLQKCLLYLYVINITLRQYMSYKVGQLKTLAKI